MGVYFPLRLFSQAVRAVLDVTSIPFWAAVDHSLHALSGDRDSSMSHHGNVVYRPALYVVNLVRVLLWHPWPSRDRNPPGHAQLTDSQAPVKTTNGLLVLFHVTTWHAGRKPGIARGQLRALGGYRDSSMSHRHAGLQPSTTRVESRAHVGCRDCSMSHHGRLGESPASRAVNFVRGLPWHPLS
ncbi:uncharacterized protein [Dermacentor albipictus]|uniref:uncharacterized protein isoform X8 n=1 Tax=Dermacentor albipictus TaxID=60249 RepID=UPI0038FCC0C3